MLERTPVLSKADFVPRYKRGEFGNASPTWNEVDEWAEGNPRLGALYHIRNRVAGGPTWYNVQLLEMKEKWDNLVSRGIDPSSLYISEMAPHEYNLIQGEVKTSEQHLDLTYTLAKDLPMRDALLADLRTAQMTEAIMILQTFLCGNSWEWLNFLLDAYEGHIVEFSTFSIPWGTLPGFNTVFWEVRPDRAWGSVPGLTRLY